MTLDVTCCVANPSPFQLTHPKVQIFFCFATLLPGLWYELSLNRPFPEKDEFSDDICRKWHIQLKFRGQSSAPREVRCVFCFSTRSRRRISFVSYVSGYWAVISGNKEVQVKGSPRPSGDSGWVTHLGLACREVSVDFELQGWNYVTWSSSWGMSDHFGHTLFPLRNLLREGFFNEIAFGRGRAGSCHLRIGSKIWSWACGRHIIRWKRFRTVEQIDQKIKFKATSLTF